MDDVVNNWFQGRKACAGDTQTQFNYGPYTGADIVP